MGDGKMYYNEYMKVEDLLKCQVLLSEKHGKKEHDEFLFIIAHQAFELWFKQVLTDLAPVIDAFNNPATVNSEMVNIIIRLKRTHRIFMLIIEQFHILETMTPMDFLNFRVYLPPVSGFQSLQFRKIENLLGVQESTRYKHNNESYDAVYTKDNEVKELNEAKAGPSLLDVVEKWLEYLLDEVDPDYIDKYSDAAMKMLGKEQADDAMKKSYEDIINKETFTEKRRISTYNGGFRFSHKAYFSALMVKLHRHDPRLQQPFEILTWLEDIDAAVAKWRHVHVNMVQRMIGNKTGTGGTTGYHYLSQTNSDKYKVFLDLFTMATYILPIEFLPKLKDQK